MKKILYIAVCAVTTFSLFGCTPSSNGQGNNNEEQSAQQGTEDTEFAKAVEDYFPTDDMYRSYNGYAEAGLEVRFDEKEQEGSAVIYKYDGAMNDGRGSYEDRDDERTFEVTYTVSGNTVKEHVDNDDYMAESENNVYSRIADQIVLSGKIEEGESWEQEVKLDGKTVTAVTTITEVTDDSFKTVLEAEADGYRDGKYTEERTYTKSKGITSFSNTPLGSDEDDMLIFGYGYSVENKQSITGMI